MATPDVAFVGEVRGSIKPLPRTPSDSGSRSPNASAPGCKRLRCTRTRMRTKRISSFGQVSARSRNRLATFELNSRANPQLSFRMRAHFPGVKGKVREGNCRCANLRVGQRLESGRAFRFGSPGEGAAGDVGDSRRCQERIPSGDESGGLLYRGHLARE